MRGAPIAIAYVGMSSSVFIYGTVYLGMCVSVSACVCCIAQQRVAYAEMHVVSHTSTISAVLPRLSCNMRRIRTKLTIDANWGLLAFITCMF